jgi:hypothetical protein
MLSQTVGRDLMWDSPGVVGWAGHELEFRNLAYTRLILFMCALVILEHLMWSNSNLFFINGFKCMRYHISL